MVNVRPLILLALLLLFQIWPQSATAAARGGEAGCGDEVAMSCCAPGHCPCASRTTEPTPSVPAIVPDGRGREWVTRPIFTTRVEDATPVVVARPLARRATVPAVALSAVPVPRTVLLCTFLI